MNTAITQQLHTIRDYIRFAFSQMCAHELYYGHGTDNAWDEALQLVFGALHLPLDTNEQLLGSNLLTEEREAILAQLNLRVEQRMPLAYIQQKAWFDGLAFFVTQDVMIPRSPLAEFIRELILTWIDEDAIQNVLDLCTGSGALAITMAQYFPEAQVDAVDISPEALTVAAENCRRHKLLDDVRLLQGNLFEPCGDQRYDVIISNPPYVGAEEYSSLPAEYHHEPQLAFTAGDDGLAIVHRILSEAADHLTPHGILVVEVGNSAELLSQAYPQVPFVWLEFSQGGDGVFILTRQQLEEMNNVR